MDKRSSVSSTHSNRSLQRESAIRAPVSEAYRDETIAQVQNSYNSRNHLPNRSKGLPLPIDPRALRAEKRSLLSETDSFISYLKCHAPSAENSTVHNVFHNLNEQFTKLVSLGQSETEETNNEHMNQICTIYNTFKDAYAQWCTQVNPNHDDVQPCDSISNVDTGTSEVSLTPPDILREQIKLELEKTKLDLAMRKAELEAREKLLALSNPASRVSQTSKQSVRHSLMPEQMRPLTQPLDNTTYAHIAQSPPGAASLEPIGLGLIHSMPVGVLGSQSNASVEAAQCPLPPTQSNLEQETRALAHNPSVSLQTPPTQAFQNYSPRRADIAQHRQTDLHSGPCQATDMFTHTPLGSEQSQRAHTFPQHSEHARSLGSNSEQLHYAPNSLPAATTRPQSLPLQQTHYTRPDQYSSTHQNQQQGGVTTYCTQQATTRTVNSGPATHAYPHHNFPHIYQFNPHNSNHSQGSNAQEYHLLLEEAREIRYTGRRLPFIFYYNQISELLRRCSDLNRHMDLLRASCQEEAQEAISALVPPVPGWSNDTQVKRALEALRLRYGCCSFLSEPLVKQVRSGPKIHKIDVYTLEKLISDLNDCELYARAHKQTDHLDSSFIIDIGERLPFFFKGRYADYLQDRFGHLDQPTFVSFKQFLNRELQRINSTFAQRFLGLSQDRTSDKTRPSAKLRVNQTNVDLKADSVTNKPSSSTQHQKNTSQAQSKQAPACFICSTPNTEQRHLLYNCATYQHMTPHKRREAIVRAGHCINCLKHHLVKDCTLLNKCKRCTKTHTQKHATSLHDLYTTSNHVGAAVNASSPSRSNLHIDFSSSQDDTTDSLPLPPPGRSSVKTVQLQQPRVFTRISAVRISNPQTGISAFVYAQHDPGSQVTLMSSDLVTELGLNTEGESLLTLYTLSNTETRHFQQVSFDLEALHTDQRFNARKAMVIPPWSDEGYTLPHNQELSAYPHFDHVDICGLPNRSKVDLLIGLDNSCLMTVVEERVGQEGEPHAIKTTLGWIASGGKFCNAEAFHTTRKVCASSNALDAAKKISDLKETIRLLRTDDDIVEFSINDRKSQEFVDSKLKVVNNRYEMPVPFKEKISTLPNNYNFAAKRVMSLRQSMLKKPTLRQNVVDSMQSLKQRTYVAPAEKDTHTEVNYLPYFLTNQAKPRVVYDGSVTHKGRCINDSIHSGPDLLNRLSYVLARFRMGKYALMADLSQCFFQILLPENQQDYFRILWFKDDDIEKGEIQVYKFTRHVWGIISSPFIACNAIHKLTKHNPTNASMLTLHTIRFSMYMDDLLYSTDTLDKAQTISSESISLFLSRGFALVKWTANKPAKPVLASMSEDKLAPLVRTIDLQADNEPLPNLKAIGCLWDAEKDTLKVKFFLDRPSDYTRRSFLSQISRQYDPLGYSVPLFVKARFILQQLAIEGFSWDEPLNSSYAKAWNNWLDTLIKWQDLALPRWYFAKAAPPDENADTQYELHAFSDASNEAYGCVLYLRRISNGTASTSFVFGKSHIVLKNQQNWPIARKELIAAVMSVRLLHDASNALQLPDCTLQAWCDSKVVLQWIRNPDLRLSKFIARRIDVIHHLSLPDDWNYCSTDENPADVATRPVTAATSKDRLKLWLEGPEYLKNIQGTEPIAIQVKQVTATTTTSEGTLQHLIEAAPDWLHRTPSPIELQKYISNTTRLVNNRPLTSLSDDPRDFNAISPSSLLTPAFHPNTPVGKPHDRDELRRDFRFNRALAQKFWHRWMKFYLPLLQRRKKWLKETPNLEVGQMVLVGGPDDLNKRGHYKLGRVKRVLPQFRRGKSIVRRAEIAVSTWDGKSGKPEVTLIERDLSKIAPLEFNE